MSKKVPLRFLPAFSFGCPGSIRDFLDDTLSWRLLKGALKGDKTAIEQLDFIARFNEEFYRSYFRDGKAALSSLHNTPELQRKLQDAVNAKQKDLWGSKTRRVPLTENNVYSDFQTMAYTATAQDEKILAVIRRARLTRGEIIEKTGLKQWVVYARMKTLVEYGLVTLIKKQSNNDAVRFFATKTGTPT